LNQFKLTLDQKIDFFEGVIRYGKKEGYCRIIYSNGIAVEGFFE